MSTYLYDEALVSKIKYWTEKTEVEVFSPDDMRNLIQTLADKNNDKPLKLPMLTLTRPRGYYVDNINKKPLTYNGKVLVQTEELGKMLNAIPIKIQYRLDVYCRYQKEADMYMRNLVFNIINYPTLSIVIPYRDINYKHNANIRMSSSIEDTSDSAGRLINGQFTRLSVDIDIDDAYLWDLRIADNLAIDDKNVIYVENPDKKTFTKETINID